MALAASKGLLRVWRVLMDSLAGAIRCGRCGFASTRCRCCLWARSATTVFDYVRRAMPHHAPKSLTDDEVYAITAHLLHLNGLVGAEAVMERDSLPKVVMPGLARTVSAWPPGP